MKRPSCKFYYENPETPPMRALLSKEGLEGYGAYWLIIAVLGITPEHYYPTNYSALALAIQTTNVELVERVVCDYDLFVQTEDGAYFYCEWLTEHCEAVEHLNQKRSASGKKAMQSRWGKKNDDTKPATEKKAPRKKSTEPRGRTCKISEQPTETEQKALDAAGMIPTEDWRHATPTYSPETVELLNLIAAKFNVIPLPAHLQMLENLLQAVHRPGVVDGLTVVRDGLAKLDTAKAILAGKPKMTITKFFDERIFMKLINGDYDELYTDKKKKGSWQDAGKTFDDMTY